MDYGHDSGNHVIGFSYDGMGNVTNDGAYTYSYDAEGRPVNLGGVTATYDALERLVEIGNSGTYTQTVYTPSGVKFAHMNGTSVKQYFLPLVGGVTAVYNSSGLQYFRHADWLGTTRLSATASGAIYYDGAYAPFGENYAETGTTDRSYTGQTQDTATGLYDFLFRQHSSAQGRWLVPDPAGRAAVDIANPQTWNRYAYVGNNPLSNVDSLGLFCAVSASGRGLVNGCTQGNTAGFLEQLSWSGQLGYWSGYNDPNNDNMWVPVWVSQDPGSVFTISTTSVALTTGPFKLTNPFSKTPCSKVTPPSGSNASVGQNMVQTLTVQASFSTTAGSGAGGAAAFLWWFSQVRPGGAWDYASNYGRSMSNSAFGNFNYGATCAVMGFSLQTCQQGAGGEDYFMAAGNYIVGKGWTAGPGNPFTGNAVVVNGFPDYGDQTNWAENPSVIAGWTYGSGGCQE